MPIVKEVLQYLDSQQIDYSLGRVAQVEKSCYRVTTILLKDSQGIVLIAYPEGYGLDLSAIRQLTHRKLEFTNKQEIEAHLPEIDAAHIIPLGKMWEVQTLVEKHLFSWPYLEFLLSDEYYVRVPAESYNTLFSQRKGLPFAYEKRDSSSPESKDCVSDEQVKNLLNDIDRFNDSSRLFNHDTVVAKLADTKALPVMPGIVHQLIRLMGNPDANINDLVEVIEQDQALVSRIISLSRSAHYAYSGSIGSVFDAVYRVIGFEDTLRIAIAMIFSRQLQGPLEGRVGLKALWMDAMTMAMVARFIATKTNMSQHLNPGVMYVAALLNNVGYMALSHLFPREYAIFNRMVSAMGDTPMSEIEVDLTDITPHSVAIRVLEFWNMPGEIRAVSAIDQTQNEQDVYSAYRDCFALVRQLVAADVDSQDLPPSIVRILDRYVLDFSTLQASLHDEKVAAEIPFIVDMMLA